MSSKKERVNKIVTYASEPNESLNAQPCATNRGGVMAASVQELVAARVMVTTAMVTEYRCWRLVRSGTIDRVTVVEAHGEDRIQAIIAEAFAGADFNPPCGEMAA
jgi:hypothetical protein